METFQWKWEASGTFHESGDGIRSYHLPPDRFLVIGGYNESISLWELPAFRNLLYWKDNRWGFLKVSESHIFLSDEQNTLYGVNPGDGKTEYILKGHTAWVNQIEELDDQTLLSSSLDGTLRVWSKQSNSLQSPVPCNSFIQNMLLWSSSLMLTCDFKGNLGWWDVASGECLDCLPAHEQEIKGLMRLDDQHVLSWSQGELGVWDVPSRQRIQWMKISYNQITDVQLIDSEQILVSDGDRSLYLWNWKTGHNLAKWDDLYSIQWMAPIGGNRILAFDFDGSIYGLDLNTKNQIFRGVHERQVTGMIPLEKDRLLTWDGKTGEVKFWDISHDFEELHTLKLPYRITFGVCLHNSNVLLSWGEDSKFHVWDIVNYQRLAVVEAHPTDQFFLGGGGIHQLKVFPKGDILTYGCDDEVALWDGHSWTLKERFPFLEMIQQRPYWMTHLLIQKPMETGLPWAIINPSLFLLWKVPVR
ncbi:MAG: hypothetical protein HQM12_11585 [SAR324 cluster bacterium]|nr:hypothetical protein [SAR324 cluster bacterium]